MDQGHNAGGVGSHGIQTLGIQSWTLSLVLCFVERIVICITSGTLSQMAGTAAGLGSGRGLPFGPIKGWRGRAAWGLKSEERLSSSWTTGFLTHQPGEVDQRPGDQDLVLLEVCVFPWGAWCVKAQIAEPGCAVLWFQRTDL